MSDILHTDVSSELDSVVDSIPTKRKKTIRKPSEDGVLADYLSRSQLANDLGVTVRTISRWRIHGNGPIATKIAGRVLFKRDDVMRWIEQQRE